MSGSYNVQPSERTEIICGSENVVDAGLKFISNAKTKIDACIDSSRPALAFDIESISKSLADIKTKKGIRLRVITEITAENISDCKQLTTLVDELRHLDGIKGSFYTSDGECLAPTIFHEEGKVASQMIYSNVRELVEHQQYVFDTLWNKSISSEEKRQEIEDGIQPFYIETIRDPVQIQKRALELGTMASDEILILYSTANALYRQGKIGAIQKLEEIATTHRLKIRVLTPLNDSIKQLVQELGKYADIRYIPEELRTQLTICVFDRKFSLVAETKDDSKNSSNEAFGLATYSNSASTVSSYVSIFETLWKQSGMYEESQNQLHSTEAELNRMKQYLNEVLKEVASFRKPVER
jgi:two-component system, OmpR family, sensor histidine kinase VicK